MKKITEILLSALMAFSLFSCSTSGKEKVNSSVPTDTDVTISIAKENQNKKVFGIGTELDPHFFSQNVGLSGTTNGENWTCEEEDWQLFETRMEEMNLKRIRVMLLPSWYVINETNTQEGCYQWDTLQMQSLYKTLDTAKKLNMAVNITMWGIDTGNASFMRKQSSEWVTIPQEEYEKLFTDCFADCVKYLIEEKEYDCIKEVTLYNEPNSLYAGSKANETYCDLCKLMQQSFEEKGIREKVLFNLSDDARDYVWMAKTLMNLEGIIDVANSHSYTYGDSYNTETKTSNRDMSNNDICFNLANYNLSLWKEYLDEYPNIPHMWGEFGTCNGIGSHTTYDKFSVERGLDIPRIMLNFFNMGSCGASYWVLFSQYYSRSDFSSNKIMDMGLWGFADENYACRPVYYSYSMLTRFVEAGDVIYPLHSEDENIVAVAFKNGNKWSYCVVNNGDEDKKVSFVNMDTYPSSLNSFIYDEKNVPINNQVISSAEKIEAEGRVISDTVKGRSFVVYTNK